MDYDFLIVGAGFSGAVLAERLHNMGKKVLVIDKRNHPAGNCYDYRDSSGVLIHKYGPHYFHTNNLSVVKYLSRFTKWIPSKYIIRSSVGGKLYPFPINRITLNKFFSVNLETEDDVRHFLSAKRIAIDVPKNAKEQITSSVGEEIYDSFFKNYTLKQWNVDPELLDPSITGRINIRTSDEDGYFLDTFQAMPKAGYTALIENLLEGIDVRLNTSFESIKDSVNYKYLIYSGRIDSYFDECNGALDYRSLSFTFEHHDREFYQDFVQINYPNEHEYTRIVEIKHITKQKISSTTISKEYPCSNPDEPYYPVLTVKNVELYKKYLQLSKSLNNVFFIGRLGEYKYYNMDQVISNALVLFEKIKNECA